MKVQHILGTTALSLALAAGSSAVFAENTTDGVHSNDTAGQHSMDKQAQQHDTEMNHNEVEEMRDEATDEEMPNRGSRAVPGAPDAGKNPDLDTQAGDTDFVEE